MVKSKTEITYQKTEENEQILALCRTHLRKYLPSYYLFPHGAFQALWNLYGAKDRHQVLEYQREYIRLADDGTISIDWAYPDPEVQDTQQVQKVCLVFPGLSGTSQKGYVSSLVKHLSQEKGYIVGVFHNRGVSNEFTSPVLPELASSVEIDTALKHMVKKFKNNPDGKNTYFVGIGMSMGANLMVRIAGLQGDTFPLDAMVSVNNPFDVWLAINLMRNTPYEKYLAYELKHQLLIKKKSSDQEKEVFKQMGEKFGLDFEAIKKVQTWREWDEHYTKKVHPEYPSIADYYLASSSLPVIQNVKVPTLVIHSKDDPIVPLDCLPANECLSNPKFIIGVVEKGGHVCYFQGVKGQKRWYPLVSSEFLDAVIELRELQAHQTDKQQDQIMFVSQSTQVQTA